MLLGVDADGGEGPAGPRELEGQAGRGWVADGFDHRVEGLEFGRLLQGRRPRTEAPRQGESLSHTIEGDDLGCAQCAGGQHRHQPYGAAPDDGHAGAGASAGRFGSEVAGGQNVAGEKRHLELQAVGHAGQGRVRQRDPYPLSLGPV